MYSGMATHFVRSENIKKMINEIETNSSKEDFDVGNILDSFHERDCSSSEEPFANSFLAQNHDVIDQTFHGKECVEDIVIALENLGPDSAFGKKTLDVLKQKSPTSLKITLESMRRGKDLPNVDECLKMEHRMTQHCLRVENKDFYEGIRALLVDGDNNPSWQPRRLEDVSDELVDSYFFNLGENELVFKNSSTQGVSIST